MLSKETELRLDHMVTDDKIGDEISARLISSTPASGPAAQAVLDLLDISDKTQKSIEERLFTGLAGDGNGANGKEISKKITKMVTVLQAKAAASGLAAAQADMGSELMSDSAFESLVHGLADRSAAKEFRSAYDAMVAAVQAIV